MSNFAYSPIPVAGYTKGAALLISQVNNTWGQVGSGGMDFWSMYKEMIFRDSAAKGGPGLQSLDGVYDLLAVDAMTIHFKGDTEAWNPSQVVGAILAGPYRAERLDSEPVYIELREGYDPAGRIRQAISQELSLWSEMLPMQLFVRLLVNGRMSPKHPAVLGYDQLALFHAAHVTNPTSSAVKPVNYSNLLQLGGQVDETSVTKVLDTLARLPGLDGTSLPNAQGRLRPLIMCPSEAVATRWAHILGGPNAPKDLFQQGQNAGISSVNVGRADITVNPYLVTMLESGNPLNIDPEKRSYVFSRRGRTPIIFREDRPPIIRTTGPQGHPSHTNDVDVMYARAYATMGIGEPRSVLAVDEK